jgi:hypothetical protein
LNLFQALALQVLYKGLEPLKRRKEKMNKIKMEKILLANVASSQLARYSRKTAQLYARRGRTVALYRYTALAMIRLAVQSHRWSEARRYRLELARAMRKLSLKGGR